MLLQPDSSSDFFHCIEQREMRINKEVGGTKEEPD
jgi:hypothetical protein